VSLCRQKEAATSSPLLETLPNVLDAPLVDKNVLAWQLPHFFESVLPRREGIDGKFGLGDGEMDRTRMTY
jgi:hypothetical protein